MRIRFFRGNPKITLRIATAVIANAIVAVTHTRYFRFSPKIPLPTRHFLFRTTFGVRLRSRLEQIFCVLLRLSERSRTIEVRVTTLSAQNLHKIFRSMLRDYVYLIDSMPTFNNLVAVICSVLHRTFCAVIRRGHYRISPKRGWARCNRNLIHRKQLLV